MVREIVSIQVGQCGNQLGNAFWETICNEHNINQGTGKFMPTSEEELSKQRQNRYKQHNTTYLTAKQLDELKLEKVNVYFDETGKHRFVPRSILVDLEPGVLDAMKARDIGKLFKPDNFVFGISGGANNWAKTHYQDGPELIDEICDVIRRSMESCDCPQGLQLTQSLGGGTGSGVGSLIMLKIRENYPDRIVSAFSVYPSQKVSDVVVEPYNATLTMPMLLQDCDQVNVIDNEALYEISSDLLKQESPKFADLNWVVSLVMSGVTASLRFPGQLNGDLRKMGVNLVPFPRLHFFTVAAAPLFSQSKVSNSSAYVTLNVREVLDQLWSGRNYLSKMKRYEGRFLSTSCIFRGETLKMYEVEDEQRKLQDKYMEDFVNWIPNNLQSSVVNVSSKYSNINGSFIGNFTGINAVFKRICKQFKKMYKKKAFLHWYINVGMDHLEIEEANKDCLDLIQELQDKNDTIVDEDNPYDLDKEEDDEELIGDSTEDENDDEDGGIIIEDDDIMDDSDSGGIIEDSDD